MGPFRRASRTYPMVHRVFGHMRSRLYVWRLGNRELLREHMRSHSSAYSFPHLSHPTPPPPPTHPPQAILREVLRGRLGLRPALDVWADGAALQHGLSRDTTAASRGIRVRWVRVSISPATRTDITLPLSLPPAFSGSLQAASSSYSRALHACVIRQYADLQVAPPTKLPHPTVAVLQARISAGDRGEGGGGMRLLRSHVHPTPLLPVRGRSSTTRQGGNCGAPHGPAR